VPRKNTGTHLRFAPGASKQAPFSLPREPQKYIRTRLRFAPGAGKQAGGPGWGRYRCAGRGLSGRMKMPLEQTAIVVQAFFDDLSIADFQDGDDGDGNNIPAPGSVCEGALKGSETTIG